MFKYLTFFVFLFYLSNAIAFEILKFNGKVEYSFDNKSWKKLLVKQKLKSGVWIKTGPKAKVTLLLPNRTQTKISRNAEFQLNYQAKEEQTQVNLKLGKIWSKTNKNRFVPPGLSFFRFKAFENTYGLGNMIAK